MSTHPRYSTAPRKPHSSKKDQGVVKPLLKPLAVFLVGALFALGHHSFNSYADTKPLDFPHAPSQVWMNRIGTAFAYAFKAALSTSLSFVLCQLMWLTLQKKFLTFSEIDTTYLTANRDVMASFFSSSILNSPLLVITVAISFLLAIPTIFTPSSLQVVPRPILNLSRPCQVPAGNLSIGTPGSIMYQTGGWGYWTGITPVAHKLAYSTFVAQNIPSLPQPCGSNCTYSVSLSSMAFQCKQGVTLPASMAPVPQRVGYWEDGFWNATTNNEGTPRGSFYVFWKSSSQSGTNGTALCTVGRANYDFTIRTVNGRQSVTYNITHTGDLIDTDSADAGKLPFHEYQYAMQLTSVSSVARSLLLGTVADIHTISSDGPKFDSPVISAGFFDSSLNTGTDFTWGDVPRGIEELSHNISAAILTMNLGVKDSNCIVSRQDVIYEYNRLNLWIPYGSALVVVLICLVLGITVFLGLNRENLTASFSDTVGITRNPSLNDNVVGDGGMRFRLGKLKSGEKCFGNREEMKLE